MIIDPNQTWKELCADITHICKIYPDLLTLSQFEVAIQEVLDCLNKKSRKPSMTAVPIKDYGEKSQVNNWSVVNEGLRLSVSVVEY